MISPWIIEQIKKKEKKQEERPRLRIPLEKRPCQRKEKELESNRGITVINIMGDDDEEEED